MEYLKKFTHTQFDNGIIINADCSEVMQIMLKNNFKADLCLTDPPYGINMDVQLNNKSGLYGFKEHKAKG